jgi:hypothetical protein
MMVVVDNAVAHLRLQNRGSGESKGECRHDGYGTAMAKKVHTEAIQLSLWP